MSADGWCMCERVFFSLEGSDSNPKEHTQCPQQPIDERWSTKSLESPQLSVSA